MSIHYGFYFHIYVNTCIYVQAGQAILILYVPHKETLPLTHVTKTFMVDYVYDFVAEPSSALYSESVPLRSFLQATFLKADLYLK